MLSIELKQQYERDGYIVLPELFSAEEMARLRAVTDEFVERSRAKTKSDAIFDLAPEHTAEAPRLRRVKKPHLAHAEYAKLVAKGTPVARLNTGIDGGMNPF